jgi:hypothetical protein
VLGIGGFLLYRALKGNDPAAPATIVMPELTNKALDQATKDLTDLGFGQDHADAAGQRRRRREHRLRAGPGDRHGRADGRRHHADLQPPKAPSRSATSSARRSPTSRLRSTRPRFPTGDRGRVGPPGRRGALAGPGPGPVPGTTVVKLTVSSGLPRSRSRTSPTPPRWRPTSWAASASSPRSRARPDDTVAAGTVIRTDPPAGAQVDKGRPWCSSSRQAPRRSRCRTSSVRRSRRRARCRTSTSSRRW